MSAIQIKSAQILRLAAPAQDDRIGIAKANKPLSGSRLHHIFDSHPHPYRMRLQIKGLSHGLKKCPPDTFLPRFARSPFRVPSRPEGEIRKRIPQWVSSFLFGTPEGTRLLFCPGMGKNRGVMPVEPGMSNSPPDCCI